MSCQCSGCLTHEATAQAIFYYVVNHRESSDAKILEDFRAMLNRANRDYAREYGQWMADGRPTAEKILAERLEGRR